MKKLIFLIIFVAYFTYAFANDESGREKILISGGDIRHKEKVLGSVAVDCSYDGQVLYLYSSQSFEDVVVEISVISGNVILEQMLDIKAQIPCLVNVGCEKNIKVVIYLPNGNVYSIIF